LQAVDATATDAARTRDTVNFQASWNDAQGNTYAVRCNRVISRGAAQPVFGGVVTNHVLYGIGRRGMPAPPTGFTYVAFWGTGDALRNGQIVGRSVAVQAALTEVLESHGSATGDPVLTQRRQFHVLVMPFSFMPGDNATVQRSVSTANMLPPDREQPCWHVVFDNPQVTAVRVRAARQTRLAGGLQDKPDVGSSAAQGAPAEAAVVGMTNSLQYVPPDIKIAVGQTVEWRNTSSMAHTVTCDPSLARNPRNVQLPEGAEPFNSGTMAPGAVFSYTFKTPGLYKYFCIPHEYAGMVGTVDVIGEP
jgi:plastocyanin